MHANVFSHSILAINTSWIYFNAHETMAPSRGWQWGRNVIFHTKLDFKPLFMPFEANSGSVCSNVKCKPQNFYLFYWLESFFFPTGNLKLIFVKETSNCEYIVNAFYKYYRILHIVPFPSSFLCLIQLSHKSFYSHNISFTVFSRREFNCLVL